jgi:DNA-binding beta-propeller fold protein YncE
VVVFGPDRSFRRLIGGLGSGAGQLHGPHGLAFGLDGRLYVADHLNDRVQVFRPDGVPVAEMGRRGQGPGELMRPTDIAVGKEGQLYVVDAGNHRIQVWSPLPAK